MGTINVGSMVGKRFVGAPAFGSAPLALGIIHGARFMGAPRLPPVAFVTDITSDLMNATDPATVIENLPDAFGRSWLDNPSDAGNGAVSFGNEDSLVGDVVEGSLIRFSYKGLPAVTMVCEVVDSTLIGGGDDGTEKVAEVTTWTGRLHGTLTEAGVWYPSRGIRQLPIQENRVCDYTDPSYDDSAWGAPNALATVEQARYFMWYISAFVRFFTPRPDDIGRAFPDPFATVMWAPGGTLARGRPLPADSGGDCYYRARPVNFTVPSTAEYKLSIFCDDSLEAAVDGVNVVTVPTGGFGNTGDGVVRMTAGPHTLAIHSHCHNDAEMAFPDNPTGAFNPGFFAWTLFRADTPNVNGFIAHSDGTGKLAPYATAPPGMTPGRAWRLFSDEAAARGVLMPARGFTDTHDSSGRPWPVVSISTRVGTDGFTFLREMSATYIDWKMRVGSFTLDMWVKGTAGVTRSVGLHGPTSLDPTSTTVQRLEKKGQAG